MNVVVYHTLPEEAVNIRESVFVREQGFQNELDEIDAYAKHLVLFDGDIPVATCRFFESETKNKYFVGRFAVCKSYRGRNLGSFLLQKAESEIRKAGGEVVLLHAQQQAAPFYEKQGYSSYGETEFDEGCPHIWMSKQIAEADSIGSAPATS